ncbi:MAG: hypothetical protein AAGG51_29385 [Cyanobacteria bacterium P01_G01_bin.54]
MSWRSWFALPVLMVSFLTVLLIQRDRLDQLQQTATQPRLAELKADLQQRELQLGLWRSLPAFGFENLFADWVLLQFFQYFGDEPARERTGYDLTLDYYEIVVDHNPRFREIYTFMGTAGAIYAVEPERTDALMTRGIRAMTPDVPHHAYTVVQNKAVNELLFLPDGEAKAQKSFAQAADWAKIYDDEESQRAAHFASSISQTLLEDLDSRWVRAGAWNLILQSVADQRSQALAIAQIRALGGDVIATGNGQLVPIFPEETEATDPPPSE